MSAKYKIIKIDESDACFVNNPAKIKFNTDNKLINKTGFGIVTEIDEKPGYYSGGLYLLFVRSFPVYLSNYLRRLGQVDYYNYRQSTEYVYFHCVKLIKVGR